MMRESIIAIWQCAARLVDKRLQEFYSPHGYDSRHLRILLTVRKNGMRAVQGEIADKLGINRNVMVQIVDDMESRGSILRRRNPDNRKEVFLTITKKGTDVLGFVDATYEKLLVQAFRPLAPHEVDDITECMRRILEFKD